MTATTGEEVSFPKASKFHGEVHVFPERCSSLPDMFHACSPDDCSAQSEVENVDFQRNINGSFVPQVQTHECEVDGFDSCLEAFRNRSQKILAQIGDHACWVAGNHVAECEQEVIVQPASDKHVTFSKDLTVVVSSGQETQHFVIAEQCRHLILRRCWTLDGTCAFRGICSTLQSWTPGESHEADQRWSWQNGIDVDPLTDLAAENSHVPSEQSLDRRFETCWDNVLDCFSNGIRVGTIETWYIRQGAFEVCQDSRGIRITPSMTQSQFEQACRHAWQDRIEPGDFQWFVVRNSPPTHLSTKGHVILCQDTALDRSVHLVHWDAWPILKKLRAVLVHPQDSVEQVLGRVRFDGNALRGRNQYGAHYADGTAVTHLTQSDVFQVPSAVVLYGYVHHVDSNSSDDGDTSDGSTGGSTSIPWSESDSDASDEVSWVTNPMPISHFDHFGPYPWETQQEAVEDDFLSDEEELVGQLEFPIEEQQQMHRHIDFIQSRSSNQESPWVAITFGLGLVSLGRRDIDFDPNELHELPQRIANAWNDHIVRGESVLYFVTPQPENLHRRQYLVFLVVVTYDGHQDQNNRKVLVRESSPDPGVTSEQPYAAILYSFMSPPAIVMELGHHECYPLGIRECHVRIGGRWLDRLVETYIQDGSLCDVYIDRVPQYVEEAEDSVIGAENMFRIARAHFDSTPGSTLFTLRIHGVSPFNQPLGSREVVVDYPDLKSLRWIREAKELWPFESQFAALAYVPVVSADRAELTDRPVLHLVLSYAIGDDRVPILVRQVLHEVNTGRSHIELWAVAVPRTAKEPELRQRLKRPPFWFHPDVRTHMKFLEDDLRLHDNEWSSGDVLDLRVNVVHFENLLAAIREMSVQYDGSHVQVLEDEQASLMQLHHALHSDFSIDPFVEACLACQQKCLEILNQDHDSKSCEASIGERAGRTRQVENTWDGVDFDGFPDPEMEDNLDLQRDEEPMLPDTEIQLAQTIVTEAAAKDGAELQEGFRVQLSLDASIPITDVRHVQADDVSFQWFEKDNWEDYCANMPAIELAQIPDGVRVKASTYHMLTSDRDWVAAPALNLVFVDGAAKDGRASWSFVVIQTDGWTQTFHGCAFGQVEVNRQASSWCGAEEFDNVAAELTALVMAQNWIHKQNAPADFVILPDLMLSRTIAKLQTTCRVHSGLLKLARVYARWIHKKCKYVHVKGHANHAWNELADTLAGHALAHGVSSFTDFPAEVHELAQAEDDLNWIWMQDPSCILAKCFPPILDEQLACISPSLRKVSSVPQPARCEPTCHTFHLSAVSVNVLAMDPLKECNDVGRQNAARTVRVDHQMHQLGAHIVGVQEARTQAGRFQSEHYHILAGGADFQHTALFGCEIWFHKTLAVLTDQNGAKCRLQDARITIQHSDPRRMIAMFEFEVNQLQVAVFHVPSVKGGENGEQAVTDWWDETHGILDKIGAGQMQLILVDANAPLGFHESQFVGTAGAESENAAGRLFQDFLHQRCLFAPTTMEWCHQTAHTTWSHPKGAKLRRDYIVVNEPLFQMAQHSQVILDYDNTFSHEDHLPVQLTCGGWLRFEHQQSRIRWDFDKMKDPVVCAQFAEALATLPLPAWEVDIDAHCKIYESQLLQLGRQFFERTTRKKQRPLLSDRTISLIGLKRSILDYGRASGELAHDDFKLELKDLERQIRKEVWGDSQVFYDNLLSDIEVAHGLADFRTVFRTLTRFGSRKVKQPAPGRPLPMLKKPNGEFAKSYREQQEVWIQQFSEIEAGVPVHWDALASMDRAGLGVPSGDHELVMLPTELEVQRTIAKFKRQKATGPNQIPTDLLKAAPAVVSQQLVCLYTKAAMHAKEPTSWKGGYVAPLYKKGPMSSAKSYRSIFISDYTAKIYHASLRRHLLDIWQKGIEHLQLGGRPSCGTDSAHHWIQVHTAWTKFHGLSQGLLFFDLKAAFYMVIRGALTEIEDSSNAVIVALTRLGIHPDDIDRMMRHASQESVTSGLTKHGAMILKDALTNTHFQMRDHPVPIVTHRGTRPGDPLADVLFNLTMHHILKDTREIIQSRTSATWIGSASKALDFGHFETVPCPAYFDVSYVDDVVFAIHGFCNDDVGAIAQVCVDAMQEAASKRGLQINFDVGKTELLWTIRGSKTRATKERLAKADNRIAWETEGKEKSLRVVHSYKHLGTWVQEKGKHSKEVQSRGNAAKSSWGPLARPFYRKKQVARHTKVRVFEALTYSRLLFGAHVWTGICEKDLDKWQNSIRIPLYSLVKGATFGFPPFQLSVEHLAGLAGLATPCDALHAARLRYIKRFLRQGHQILWAMMWDSRSAPGNWIDLCLQSFHWLLKFCPKKLPLMPDDGIVEWFSFVALDTSWKGKVNAAIRSCKQFRRQYARQHVWEKAYEMTLASVGVPPASHETPVDQGHWECDLCNECFKSKCALAMHAVHKHGYRTMVKYFAIGDTCPSCLKWYHCRARFKTHLVTSEACLARIACCFPPLPNAAVEELDIEDKQRNRDLKKEGWWATKALFPVMRIQGPALPPAGSPEASLMFQKALLRQDAPGDAFQMMQGRWIASEASSVETDESSRIDIPAVVMHSQGGKEVGNGQLDEGGLARVYAKLHLRCMVFVHFFSGYRRLNDLHTVLQEFSDGHGGMLYVISVDLCLQKADADLCSDASVKFWIDRIKAGQIVGAGGGPPCETFSAARLQSGGPPPLRDQDHLSGLPSLTERQWKQVDVGSILVRFMMEVLLWVAITGGCAFAEHPQWPAWAAAQKPASIWITRPIKMLKQLRCTSAVSFDQCVMNAGIRKPTTLLLIRLRPLREKILTLGSAGRCCHGKQAHTVLQGKDDTGAYKTSYGKVYPPMLNLLLGRAVADFIQVQHGFDFSGDSLPQELEKFQIGEFADSHVVQPDFYG